MEPCKHLLQIQRRLDILRNHLGLSTPKSLKAKILEKIIYDQLYNYLNVNDLLTSCQSGFRPLHSTLTALLETSNNWGVNVDKGQLKGVIFIDLKKAFDTIDDEIILQKLAKYGVDQDNNNNNNNRLYLKRVDT